MPGRRRWKGRGGILPCLLLATLFAAAAPGADLAAGTAPSAESCPVPMPPPGQRDRNALWRIVHCRCAPAAQQGEAPPIPCAEVALRGDGARGSAVLKDLVGRAQYLLIPTARVTGMEDPAILAPGAPNYFADAWEARRFVEAALGHELPPEAMSLAINPAVARTQDQLHIHMDCLHGEVRDALEAAAPRIAAEWAPLDIELVGRRGWLAMRSAGVALQVDPVMALAGKVPGAREAMGHWTVAVVGLRPGSAVAPGFLILAGRHDEVGVSERLQDHECRIATGR